MPHFEEAAKAVVEMMNEESHIRTWFFTFGHGHPLNKFYIGVIAPTWQEARAAMTEIFGTKWAFQYEANDPVNGVAYQEEEYGIVPLFHINVSVDYNGRESKIVPQAEFAFAAAVEKRR